MVCKRTSEEATNLSKRFSVYKVNSAFHESLHRRVLEQSNC